MGPRGRKPFSLSWLPHHLSEEAKYGGQVFTSMAFNEETTCMMRFSFGRLLPEGVWPLRASFMPQADLMTCIHHTINGALLPAVGHITTLTGLLALLVENDEPFRWVSTNCAIRAAQVVALAEIAGVSLTDSFGLLEGRELWIANSVSRSSAIRGNPREYIAKVREDWVALKSKVRLGLTSGH
jgi:hypothetical protein